MNGIKKKTLIICLSAALALVLAAGVTSAWLTSSKNIYSGVEVGGIPLGNLTKEQAAKVLLDYNQNEYKTRKLVIQINEYEFAYPFTAFSEGIDVKKTAEDAYRFGRDESFFKNVRSIVSARMGKKTIEATLTNHESQIQNIVKAITAEISHQDEEEALEIKDGTLLLNLREPSLYLDEAKLSAEIIQRLQTLDTTEIQVEDVTVEEHQLDWNHIKSMVDRDAADAKVDTSQKNSTTILPEQIGYSLDIEKGKQLVGGGEKGQYEIPLDVTEPKIRKDQLEGKLYLDQLSTATTSFNTGNVNRASNIRLAVELMNGTVLNAGDRFSFNGIVGSRSYERGFKDAGVFQNGKVVEGVGGGVCQASTTAYMAAIYADLKIVERHHHMFAVGYTALGQDASVYFGVTDMIFENDTPYPMRVSAEVKGGRITVSLYGTKTGNRTVEYYSKVLQKIPYEVVRKDDATLAPGTEKVMQQPYTGYVVELYKKATENGKTETAFVHKSRYNKLDEIIHVGPLKEAPVSADPETPTDPTVPAPPDSSQPADSGDEKDPAPLPSEDSPEGAEA